MVPPDRTSCFGTSASPIVRRDRAIRAVTGHEMHRARHVATGQRHLRTRRGRAGGGHAGHNFHRNSGRAELLEFFAAAAEHERTV
jgi:hypothetical protein